MFVFLIGSYQCLNNWGNRLKKYKSLTAYRISNSLTNSSTSLTFGVLKIGGIGLLLGVLLGNIVGLIVLGGTLFSSIKNKWHYVSFIEMRKAAIEYKIFPLANTLQASSDVFQLSGVIYFISYFFSAVVVGWYSFAIRILQAPMNLIGAAMAQVFYQQASSNFNKGIGLQPLVKATIIKSALIGLPVLLALIFLGPILFAFIFGENWREAGVYAQILSPWIYLDFIRAPISQIPIVINKQKNLLLFSIIGNVILIISMFYAGLIVKDIKFGFQIFVFFQSIYLILLIRWIYKIANINAISS
jgi:O-antigen/teichoic acid export membrane protein